jgi:hypothetical protein
MPLRRAAWLLLLTGCYSFSTLGRARVLERGRVELFGAPALLAVPSNNGAFLRPVADVGVRYGLEENVELDARVTTLGLTAGPRIQLRRAEGGGGIDVLLAPAVAFTYPQKVAIELPIVAGWNARGEDQLIVAPRMVYQARLDVPGAPPASFLLAGASVGYAWKISPRWTLMPEVALLTQLYAQPGFSSDVANTAGVQASIGVLFDP